MKYWLMIDDRRTGPLTLAEATALPLTPETPVWRDGLPDWVTCSELPEMSILFHKSAAPPPPPVRTEQHMPFQPTASPVTEPAPEPQPVAEIKILETLPPCPPTYLAWSVVVTVLCCIPIGVVGIIFSSKVTNAWRTGDMEKAEKYSEWAQWCIISAIALGLLMSPVQMMLGAL